MRYALIKNKVVVQIDCNDRDGFVEVGDNVVCGMICKNDNFVLPPTPEKTSLELIIELESKQTPRLLREAALGQQYAINILAEIDTQITALRVAL